MDEVTVADFRCFREEQTARLAPLTILVGENSTGKTSFLALVRVLWDMAIREQLPDFKEPPYDLGSFDEIAHYRGGRGGRAPRFSAGFSTGTAGQRRRPRSIVNWPPSRYHVTFRRDDLGILPGLRRVASASGKPWAECRISEDRLVSLTVATSNGQWTITLRHRGTEERLASSPGWDDPQHDLPPLGYLMRTFQRVVDAEPERLECFDGTKRLPTAKDLEEIRRLPMPSSWRLASRHDRRPFASAPVRSRPRRTYDPTQAIPDSEGEYIPTHLATVARRYPRAWNSLKQSLEDFGREAGLFDEIGIKVLGGKTGGPFQVQIRKFGSRAKGPFRNVIDIGYGVSQALPVVTELLRSKVPQMFLLQQPEVHLHPSAQAALGGLFCRVAASRRRQLIVETHSDHLIDRVRMDIRDGKTKLKPDDVSILYFQRRNLAVTIHSLGWDADGNLVAKRGNIPEGYRQFFRSERRRSLGL